VIATQVVEQSLDLDVERRIRLAAPYWYVTRSGTGCTCIVCAGSSIGTSSS
jgi:hypothetical protein